MASAVEHRQFHERRSAERRRILHSPKGLAVDGMRVSWGGIFGGVLVALGVLLLLAALGLAVGITAADPGQTDARTLGTGAGLWAAASLLLALFIGGMVSTLIGAIYDRATGVFEGALVWIVSVLLMAYMAASGVGMLASGAFSLVSGATQAVGAVFQGASGDLSSDDVDQMLERLKDPNTAQQLATATGVPRSEVQSTLSEIAQRVENARENPAQAAAEVRQGVAQIYEKARASGAIERRAEELQPRASQAAWITFGALLLSLLAAVLGAMLGRRRAHVQARSA
jgi:tape measure domain-containing protein